MTMNKTPRLLVLGVAVVFGVLAMPWTAMAGSDSFDHDVTVQVDSILSITYEDDPDILMEFIDSSAAGDLSTGKYINYTVGANNMTTGALSDALTAKIDATIDGVDIVTADSSIAYTNDGTASNAVLVPVGTAPVTIGTTAVPLFTKAAGPAAPGGKILRGHAAVYYQAKATRDLSPADGGTCVLTATLKDS